MEQYYEGCEFCSARSRNAARHDKGCPYRIQFELQSSPSQVAHLASVARQKDKIRRPKVLEQK